MGDLEERLIEFQEQTKGAYRDIMKILEDNYCWKCPMRSTSTQSRCREVHAGRVLQEAVDEGILGQLISNDIPELEIESMITRILKKKIKRQGGKQKEKNIIFNVEDEQNLDLAPDNCLMVKVNPKRARVGDQILIPDEALEHPVLGAYALIAGFPFQIAEVKKTYHEGSFWYVEIENERILPLESVFGILIKILKDD